MEHLSIVILAAVIYLFLCKVVYNGVLADPKEQFSDLAILKTCVIAVGAAGLAKYAMDKYAAVNVPWQGAVPLPPLSAGVAPLSQPRLATLVPQ